MLHAEERAARQRLGYTPWACLLCHARFFAHQDALLHFSAELSRHPESDTPQFVEIIDVDKERSVRKALKMGVAAPHNSPTVDDNRISETVEQLVMADVDRETSNPCPSFLDFKQQEAELSTQHPQEESESESRTSPSPATSNMLLEHINSDSGSGFPDEDEMEPELCDMNSSALRSSLRPPPDASLSKAGVSGRGLANHLSIRNCMRKTARYWPQNESPLSPSPKDKRTHKRRTYVKSRQPVSQLIAESILQSSSQRLSVPAIFSSLKSAGVDFKPDAVRTALSMNDCFVRVPRPSTIAKGPSHVWTLHEASFVWNSRLDKQWRRFKVHTDVKHFCCDDCRGAAFATAYGLMCHRNFVH